MSILSAKLLTGEIYLPYVCCNGQLFQNRDMITVLSQSRVSNKNNHIKCVHRY